MTIRRATEADATAIAAMLAQLASETDATFAFGSTAETIRAHGFGPGALFDVLIAERDGAATGLALYFRHFSTYRGQPGVYVQDLWVAPEARRTGLGAALLAEVARAAREGWGARYLALTTHGANVSGRAFYARLGFTAQEGDIPMMLDGAGFASLCAAPEAAA